MPRLPDEAILALVALLVVASHVLMRAVRRWVRRTRIRRRLARAAEGEVRAARWLVAQGYEIVGAQVAKEYELLVDGAAFRVGLQADFLATRAGRLYVVEVKTGKLAPRLATSATRRQLLEYRVAYGAVGTLVVDAEAGVVHEVTFPPMLPAPRDPARWRIAAGAFALGLLVALAREAAQSPWTSTGVNEEAPSKVPSSPAPLAPQQ